MTFLYLFAVPIIPYLGYRYILYVHNSRLIETLKILSKQNETFEKEEIQKKIKQIIDLMYTD
jgi:hypothetical protein